MAEIEVDFFLLAQDVEQVPGALTIWRGGMRTLVVPRMPFTVANLSAAVGLGVPTLGGALTVDCKLIISGVDIGTPRTPGGMQTTWHVAHDPMLPPEEATHIVLALSLFEVEINEVGHLGIGLHVNGKIIKTAPLRIITREQQITAQQKGMASDG